MTIDWTQANCIGTDGDSFFPEQPSISPKSLPLRVCAACDIMEECKEYAILHERHGIWGGTNPTQREEHRKRRGILVDVPSTLGYIGRVDLVDS